MDGYIQTLTGWREEMVESPPIKGVPARLRDPGSSTYVEEGSSVMERSEATSDIPQAVIAEVVEQVRGGVEEDPFRRSSKIMRSPPITGHNSEGRGETSPGMPRGDSLPNMELMPIVCVERVPSPRIRDMVGKSQREMPAETDPIVLMDDDEPAPAGEGGEMSEASSSISALSKAVKRGRGALSTSGSASVTEDETSGTGTESGRRKRRGRGRPRTTNIIDVIRAREREREEEKKKERDDWEEKRMRDPNLVVPPASNLPSLEDTMAEMEGQPTPDVTSEVMQVVRTIEKVATTAKNLKGTYVGMLRSAALKVHAGLNVLAYRAQQEKGKEDEEVTTLRKKVRALQVERSRMERETEQASIHRREAEKIERENEELRRRLDRMEEEMRKLKERLVEEAIGGRHPGGGEFPPVRSPRPLPRVSPPAGAAREMQASLSLISQIEETVLRIVEQALERFSRRGSWDSLPPPPALLTPTMDVPPSTELDRLPAPEAPAPGLVAAEPKRAGKKKKKKKKKGSTAPSLEYFGRPQEEDQPRAEPSGREVMEAPVPASPTWATVVGRRGGADGGAPPRPQRPIAVPAGGAGSRPGGGGGGLPPLRVGRAPATAAVTITAPEGTYADVLRKARRDIGTEKLRDLGIEDVRSRRGMTGSYVLEIPGPVKEDRESKAEALAAEMRRVFAEDSSVRIERPMAAVRVLGLDEAVTAEDIISSIAGRGVARPEELRVAISRSAYGMGAAIAQLNVIYFDVTFALRLQLIGMLL